MKIGCESVREEEVYRAAVKIILRPKTYSKECQGVICVNS